MNTELFSTKPETLPASAGRGKSKQILRYLLLLGVAISAYANRRHFGMTTAWLPHLLGNSLSLLLPELYTLARPLFLPASNSSASSWEALQRSFEQLVPENPDYVDYVAPVALACIVAHPNFNIYQGEMGELDFLGFGLDSLPHSATAYSLSNLVYDTVETLRAEAPPETTLHALASWSERRKHLVAGGVLAFLSFIYEMGEYLIQRSELKACNNDPSQVSMVWSVQDTIFDLLSNAIGWAIAAWGRRR